MRAGPRIGAPLSLTSGSLLCLPMVASEVAPVLGEPASRSLRLLLQARTACLRVLMPPSSPPAGDLGGTLESRTGDTWLTLRGAPVLYSAPPPFALEIAGGAARTSGEPWDLATLTSCNGCVARVGRTGWQERVPPRRYSRGRGAPHREAPTRPRPGRAPRPGQDGPGGATPFMPSDAPSVASAACDRVGITDARCVDGWDRHRYGRSSRRFSPQQGRRARRLHARDCPARGSTRRPFAVSEDPARLQLGTTRNQSHRREPRLI